MKKMSQPHKKIVHTFAGRIRCAKRCLKKLRSELRTIDQKQLTGEMAANLLADIYEGHRRNALKSGDSCAEHRDDNCWPCCKSGSPITADNSDELNLDAILATNLGGQVAAFQICWSAGSPLPFYFSPT